MNSQDYKILLATVSTLLISFCLGINYTLFKFKDTFEIIKKFHLNKIIKITSSILCLCILINYGLVKIKSRRVSIQQNRDWVQKEEFRVARTAGSEGKIAICMFYTDNIAHYGDLARKINLEYAKKHGYEFLHFRDRMSKRDPQWDKLLAVKKCLETKGENGDYAYNFVVWIDADAYFNDQDMTMETFVHPGHDLIFCDAAWGNAANAGVFLAKNSDWSREFFDLWWKMGEGSNLMHNLYHEQEVFDGIFKYDMCGARKKTLILESTVFNSNPFVVCQQKKGWDKTFVVHLMAMPYKKRCQIMNNYIERNLDKKYKPSRANIYGELP